MLLPESERAMAIQKAKEWMLDNDTQVLEASRYGVALRHSKGDILVITLLSVEYTPAHNKCNSRTNRP